MTKTDFVRILSRAFALYLLVWGLSAGLTLPELLYSFLKYLQASSELARRDYWTTYYLLRVISESIRAVVMLTFSLLFWKSWRTVGELLIGDKGGSDTPLESDISKV